MSWCKTDLPDVIAAIQSGSRPKGGVSIDSGEVMSLGGENILQQGGVELRDVKRVPIDFYMAMTKGHLQHRDVLINKDGANTGKVGLFRDTGEGPACINEHLFLLRGDASKITQEYLYYTLLSERGQTIIRNRISGSAQPGLKAGFINNFSIELPQSTNEQNEIARILQQLDRAIEQTEALIVKQQRIKTGLMQNLLIKGIDEQGNIRSEATHAFKDSPLGRIPVEWDMKTLGKVAKQVTSGSRGWARYYSNEGAIFLRIGNLTREHINLRLDDLVFVQVTESLEGKRTAVQEGDLLISITADLGIIGIIPKGFAEAYVNQHIALIRLDSGIVIPRFVGHLLGSAFGRTQIESLNESGAKAGLNLPTVESLLVAIPQASEQEHIAEILDAVDKQIKGDKSRLKKLAHQKAGLMHDLLTGDRRVTPLLAQSATQ